MLKLYQVTDLILAILGDIGIIDIIDILVISYAIYRILLFIEDSRAFNLLKGLGFLAVAYVLTKELNLITINSIIESLIPTSIIAMIIIFQPELRLGLEDLGKSRFLHERQTSEAEFTEVSNEICKTLEECSQKRRGVLIVIEQDVSLNDYVRRSGTIIRGKVTSELLNTIFYYGTPLHDGAVIIKSNMIESAACYLNPTNYHKGIDKDLGSRHRAAAGLTEVTDAIVFIVSEETGAIRYSRNGKINTTNMDGLRKLVYTSLIRAAKYEQQHKEDKR